MQKSQFQTEMHESRSAFNAAITQLSAKQMVKRGVNGEWSAKDILAHITWHENQMIGVLEQRALTGSHLWNLPLDQRNQAIYEENKDRSLEDVLQEAERVYPFLLKLVEGLTDEDLNNPANFAEFPPEWMPWKLLAENTYEHYLDHLGDLQELLGSA